MTQDAHDESELEWIIVNVAEGPTRRPVELTSTYEGETLERLRLPADLVCHGCGGTGVSRPADLVQTLISEMLAARETEKTVQQQCEGEMQGTAQRFCIHGFKIRVEVDYRTP